MRNLFEKFMEERGLLEAFKTNANSLNIKTKYDTLWENNTYKKHPAALIDGAFIWSKTPEGHRFWKDVSNSWHFFCKENGLA